MEAYILTRSFGYYLNGEERKSIKSHPDYDEPIWANSGENYYFELKTQRITLLLILSEKVGKIDDFDDDEKKLFVGLAGNYYEDDEETIEEMKSGKSILLEQAIVAIVSNWETYFSDIIKNILDDDQFIEQKMHNKNEFKKFLNNFKLIQDFQQNVVLNRNKFMGLKFGTYIAENKKINFQNLESIKIIFKSFFDIDIVNLSNDWTEIDKLFAARHILVHGSPARHRLDYAPLDSIENNKKFRHELKEGKRKLSEIFDKNKIEKLMSDMVKIVYHIDCELFEIFDTEYLKTVN